MDDKINLAGRGGTIFTNATQIPYQYKYQGQELQDELGLNLYDYHARNYDPALGRWNVIDPMVPKYFSHSPYAYTLNNPVYFIDPTGMMVEMGDQLENGDPPVVGNGGPTVYMGELDGLVLTAKAPQRSSSSSSGSGFSLSMSGFGFRSSFSSSNTPNFWDGAYRNMLSDDDLWSAGIKSFMVSPLGTATGSAMEAVTNKTAGTVVEAVHNNAQGFIIDDSLKH